jgi:hypothetical protein
MLVSTKNNKTLGGYLNADGEEIEVCEAVYEKKGADQYNNCKRAYATGNKTLAKAYEKALEGSFNGTFEEWKSKQVGAASSLFGSIVDAFKGTGGIAASDLPSTPTPEKNNTGLVIGVVAVAAIGIFAGVYFYNNSK